ncbi:MAG: valine--tRNA ligase, partial [Lachnospiraceae bacterium]|nr:valine--tRNA ligase [Lachnospiraceae bacterium]
QLHMGHALDNAMQDTLIRYKKMQGFNTLWQPGTDHAAIATEVKIIKTLKEQGIDKNELGRDGFLKRAWEWKDEYAGRIVGQLKKMGAAADWERQRFTMDEGCSEAVAETFVALHKKGLIYKGNRIVNWCPVCKTSISDAEVEHVDQAGHFWHINYPIKDSDEFVEIATTRPETMIGDTAIAVNPKDERFKHLIGKKAILPLVGREIPIVADEYVDMEFGTGCVKITPAHDPNDFEVGKRHDLEEINVMNDDATMNEKCGKYEGMDRYEARKAMIEDLKEQGLLVKIVDHSHNVGTHDRCKTTIEPMAKPQWFVKMDELVKPAIKAIDNGDLKFVPENYSKIYLNWLAGMRDWCISRQLWWGHRIPAYYCQDCGEIVVAKEAPTVCPKCGKNHFEQDPDTLDTWFSSALWPFSTLGWPKETEELKYYYPTDVLVTGYDIIIFWVIRMVVSGYEHTGKCPFHTVLIHGLVRDANGLKMSKSLGNGIDPLEIIDQYGADALRMALLTGNAPGNDMRFRDEKMEASRNFANKVWNASRFIMMNLEGQTITEPKLSELNNLDKAILCKINNLAKEVTDNLDKYELGIALTKVYDFIWDEFCDWYIEMSKPVLWAKEENPKAANATLWTLKTVLSEAMKMLHPFMPFITEEIYCTLLPEEESIMLTSWPQFKEEWNFAECESQFEMVKELVRGIRNTRTGMDVPPSRKAKVIIVAGKEEVRNAFAAFENSYKNLASANEIVIQAEKTGIDEDAVSVVTADAVCYIPLAELIDFEKEKARLTKEKERLEKELARSHNMLNNEKFVSKAPAAKIQEEKDKLAKYEQMMEEVTKRLEALK